MFNNLVNWIFTKIPIVKKLDGYKTYISLTLFILSLIAQGLAKAAELIPAANGLGGASESIAALIQQIADMLSSVGISGLAVSAVANKAKLEKSSS